jgi:hypothetical protein
MKPRTLLRTGLVAAAVLATGLATVTSGHAAVASAHGTTGAATVSAEKASPAGSPSTMSHMITCTSHVDPPERFGYLILMVVVRANVTCVMELDDGRIVFAPVDLIDMDVHLTKFGLPGAGTSSEHFHATHASYLRGHATRFCHEGWYQGWMEVTITFPPEFKPRTQTHYWEGPEAYLTCAD